MVVSLPTLVLVRSISRDRRRAMSTCRSVDDPQAVSVDTASGNLAATVVTVIENPIKYTGGYVKGSGVIVNALENLGPVQDLPPQAATLTQLTVFQPPTGMQQVVYVQHQGHNQARHPLQQQQLIDRPLQNPLFQQHSGQQNQSPSTSVVGSFTVAQMIGYSALLVSYILVMSLAAAACTAPWTTFYYARTNAGPRAPSLTVTVFLDYVQICNPTAGSLCSSINVEALAGTIDCDKGPLLIAVHLFSALLAVAAVTVILQIICHVVCEASFLAVLAPVRAWLQKNRKSPYLRYVSIERSISACSTLSFLSLLPYVIFIKPGDFNKTKIGISEYSTSGATTGAGLSEMISCVVILHAIPVVALIILAYKHCILREPLLPTIASGRPMALAPPASQTSSSQARAAIFTIQVNSGGSASESNTGSTLRPTASGGTTQHVSR